MSRTEKNFPFSLVWAVAETVPPPSTFLLPCPHAPKLAAIARYCSRSLKRALDESMAAGFLVRLMERLIPDRDPTDLILRRISENGGPLRGCK